MRALPDFSFRYGHGEASWQGPLRFLAASAVPFTFARADQPISSGPAPNAIPPAEALDRLMQGNVRYAAGESEWKDYSVGRAERVAAQYPIAAILELLGQPRRRPSFCSIRVPATSSSCALPAISSTTTASRASNMR